MEYFNIDNYLEKLISRCKESFGGRLVYAGLQGSYLRGEATENSDIDVMIVIDDFSVEDMKTYRAILKEIGWYEKSCGFICGKADLANWNPLEALQLKYTTKDLFGKLETLLPPATRQDEINYVKISLGNFYHEICHRYIHTGDEKSRDKLRACCKQLYFVIQNLHYLESGNFLLKKSDVFRNCLMITILIKLMKQLSPGARRLLQDCLPIIKDLVPYQHAECLLQDILLM